MPEGQPDPGVLAEIKAVRYKEGVEGLNNFHGNLPGGWRETFYASGMLDRKTEGMYMGKSLREFLSDVDKAIEDEKIDADKLKALQDEFRQGSPRKRTVVLEEIRDLTFPVYRRLKLAGYTHRDLTA